jgi:hypothetical protein
MVLDNSTNIMSTISDVIGYLPKTGKVIGENEAGEFFAGDPQLVAEIANDHYARLDPSAYAKRVCIHAMINHDNWRWTEYRPSNPSLFRWTLKAYNREKFSFPIQSRVDSNDPAVVLGS